MAQLRAQDQIPSISMAQAVLVPFPTPPLQSPTSDTPDTDKELAENLRQHKLQVQQNILLQAAQALVIDAHAQSTLPHVPFSSSSASDAASENDAKALTASLYARWVPSPSRPRPVYTSAKGQAGAGAGAGADVNGEWTSVAARVVLEAAERLEEVEQGERKEGGAGGGGGGKGGAAETGGGSGAYDASRDPRLRR